MLRRIHHIELIVLDLERQVEFFKQLGFEEVRRTHHHQVSVEMKLPDQEIVWELHQMEKEEVIGINHVGFEVEDVPAAFEDLLARGVKFQRDPYHYDIPDVEDKTWRVADFRDPSGFRYHILDTKGGEKQEGEDKSLDVS